MEFKTVGGHTFSPKLLNNGCIIDVGCRGFDFANHFEGKKVYCLDIDPEVFEGHEALPHVMMNVGIAHVAGDAQYYANGEATCLKQLHHFQDHLIKPCKTITMDGLYAITGENVDVLKLDCEGAEYIILGEKFKPIPKQITVEFHYHCVPELHIQDFNNIINRLTKYYTIHNMVWEARHGCGFNYWDVLFIKR